MEVARSGVARLVLGAPAPKEAEMDRHCQRETVRERLSETVRERQRETDRE